MPREPVSECELKVWQFVDVINIELHLQLDQRLQYYNTMIGRVYSAPSKRHRGQHRGILKISQHCRMYHTVSGINRIQKCLLNLLHLISNPSHPGVDQMEPPSYLFQLRSFLWSHLIDGGGNPENLSVRVDQDVGLVPHLVVTISAGTEIFQYWIFNIFLVTCDPAQTENLW